MPTHHIQLTNTGNTNYDLYPTSSPASITLQAQDRGIYFDYGATFTSIDEVLIVLGDTQPPVLTLDWPGASDPQWGMQLLSGQTSCTVSTIGTSTKFTYSVPATGASSTFQLTPTGSSDKKLKVTISRP